MNWKIWTWQIWKRPTDEPKKWHCCDMLVKPSELHEHYKNHHMNVISKNHNTICPYCGEELNAGHYCNYG